MEVSSRRARTSYLMAARRGEPALEVEPLGTRPVHLCPPARHGGRPLAAEPKEVADLDLPSDADFNKDGIVSTSELDAYAKQVLPRLSGIFPRLAGGRREGVAAPRNAPAQPCAQRRAAQPLDQALRLQGNETAFPLIPINEP